MYNNGFCGGNCWWIIILLLLLFCCGNGNQLCGANYATNYGNGCGCERTCC